MHVFWEHGYEAASIADLTAAMGITPPSLYTAFGDKEQLFLETVECLWQGPGRLLRARARRGADRAARSSGCLLEEAAAELTQDCHPLGCMMVMATTNCSVAAEHVQSALARARRAVGVESMQARIQRGIDEGELPADADAGALANFYATVYQGMSMQAKDGASKRALLASVTLAMRARGPTRRRSLRARRRCAGRRVRQRAAGARSAPARALARPAASCRPPSRWSAREAWRILVRTQGQDAAAAKAIVSSVRLVGSFNAHELWPVHDHAHGRDANQCADLSIGVEDRGRGVGVLPVDRGRARCWSPRGWRSPRRGLRSR